MSSLRFTDALFSKHQHPAAGSAPHRLLNFSLHVLLFSSCAADTTTIMSPMRWGKDRGAGVWELLLRPNNYFKCSLNCWPGCAAAGVDWPSGIPGIVPVGR
ncbi:unnamed protein product [Pleuronectes platessa]|uniref:Uncharacterized protein n=1 Tax=Pleuronectes platessa TaxID=8262 RepID=A0A9N7VF82_PLEPL|nr:unnamed protein product [Pleuronectes platessa]